VPTLRVFFSIEIPRSLWFKGNGSAYLTAIGDSKELFSCKRGEDVQKR